MSKKRAASIFFSFGVISVLMGLILPLQNMYRTIFAISGIFLNVIGVVLLKKHKVVSFFASLIVIFTIVWGLDFLFVWQFDRYPAIAFMEEEGTSSRIYNAFYYRLWDCDDVKTLDLNYQKGYLCSKDSLETKDVNAFLGVAEENYKTYKNKFVKISGKISSIDGIESIQMQSYTKDETSLNGKVTFTESPTMTFFFNQTEQQLSKLSVYDSVTVIGKVERLEKKKGEIIIHVKDSVLVTTPTAYDYTVKVEPAKYCEADKKSYATIEETTFYTSCIDHVYIHYENGDVYELSYALQEKKVKLDDLLKDGVQNEPDKDENVLFRFADHVVIVCKNEDVIIGNKSTTTETCASVIEEETGV